MPKRAVKKQTHAERDVEAWNKAHPIDTRVRYWKGLRQGEPTGETETRSLASVLGGHTAVVWVKGEPGCIALSHVEPVA